VFLKTSYTGPRNTSAHFIFPLSTYPSVSPTYPVPAIIIIFLTHVVALKKRSLRSRLIIRPPSLTWISCPPSFLIRTRLELACVSGLQIYIFFLPDRCTLDRTSLPPSKVPLHHIFLTIIALLDLCIFLWIFAQIPASLGFRIKFWLFSHPPTLFLSAFVWNSGSFSFFLFFSFFSFVVDTC